VVFLVEMNNYYNLKSCITNFSFSLFHSEVFVASAVEWHSMRGERVGGGCTKIACLSEITWASSGNVGWFVHSNCSAEKMAELPRVHIIIWKKIILLFATVKLNTIL